MRKDGGGDVIWNTNSFTGKVGRSKNLTEELRYFAGLKRCLKIRRTFPETSQNHDDF